MMSGYVWEAKQLVDSLASWFHLILLMQISDFPILIQSLVCFTDGWFKNIITDLYVFKFFSQ